MITPDQLDEFTKESPRRPNGYNLLFQSGGAARGGGKSTSGGTKPGSAQALYENTAERNPYFNEDFYLDNISILNIMPGKGTGSAHAACEIKFTVTEPSNITLINRLYLAAQDLAPKSDTKVNVASTVYLMIIRFYAQDLAGNIVEVGKPDQDLTQPSKPKERKALVERYIPFQVKTINMTIDSKLVNYDWECTPLGMFIGTTSKRGTIPFNVELSGATVDQVINGEAKLKLPPSTTTQPNVSQPKSAEEIRASALQAAKAPPPPKMNQGTVLQGLVQAMNQQQQIYVKEGRRQFADTYRIEYSPEAEARIKEARITKPSERVVGELTPTIAPANDTPQNLLPDKQRQVTTERNVTIAAGMQMVQVLEMIIRNSHYITDQANINFDEYYNQVRPNDKYKGNNKGFQWFSVVPKAVPRNQYDTKINDYACDITYYISVYEVRAINSPYFNAPRFQGVHKKYHYWFTGENNAVLDYKETHNNMYYQTLTGSLDYIKQNFSSSMIEIPYYWPAARSNESGQGALGRANDLAANAAENLYNLADLANAKLKIIGDPAWIAQGSVVGLADPRQLTPAPFNADGSINFDTQDVLFEIAWQLPEDYSISTGLADPYSRTQAATGERKPLQSRIYRAVKVLSEFRGGTFEQTIEGTIYMYPVPNGTNRAPDTKQPAQTATTANANEIAVDTTRSNEPESLVRTNPITPNILAGVTDVAATTGLALPSTATLSGLLNSARMQNTAGPLTGPLIPPQIDFSALGTGTALLPSQATLAADQLQTALAAGPVTSNGLIVGLNRLRTVQPDPKPAQAPLISRDT
jgi:hypothetical protein